jgi:hypothetical protein
MRRAAACQQHHHLIWTLWWVLHCRMQCQAAGKLRNPSRYGYASPLPVADLRTARDEQARRTAAERRELRLDGSHPQLGAAQNPALTVRRFTRKEPTHAEQLAVRKALLETAMGDLRGEPFRL